MSDSPQSSVQDQSEGVKRNKPPPVRDYQHQIRSLLGKRDHEEAASKPPKKAATTPEPSHLTPPHALHSRNVGHVEESGFGPDNGSIFTVDGAADKGSWRWGKPVTAIFIHAGAGYHSSANEEHHLKACSDAARVGMKALRAGRTATEAAEAALVVLENKEITNAGYGSNLSIDGTVECDATIVDHFGRSGACGAVPNVKNPISLARMILESSNKPLSLRRVPPNLLVCDGARDFAKDSGMTLVHNDELVSKNARDRFVRWRDDMKRAESHDAPLAPASRGEISPQHDQDPRKEHTKAILTATWNEGQPDSPPSTSPWLSPQNRQSPVPTDSSTLTPSTASKPTAERSPLSFLGSSLQYKRHRFMPAHSDGYTDSQKSPGRSSIPSHDRASDEGDTPVPTSAESHDPQSTKPERDGNLGHEDHIVDTVVSA
ncbi:hypothetical protein NPX13_g9693 [Xylaria arbuscula]|uniref:N-terminal nucleophile aminohydrolase n=1 Tax=Xylaria arbuscula TaxID=114810 RepID=A0A9W8TIM8_9PEZI|nr:hypothetical protein NPX13_g9693 [Xylaria arbuscula]